MGNSVSSSRSVILNHGSGPIEGFARCETRANLRGGNPLPAVPMIEARGGTEALTNPDLKFHGSDQDDRTAQQSWVPSIDTHVVLERLIADELRAGRLTPGRRRRIVRYAAGMGLSAVQAGRLVSRIRDEALASDDPELRSHALRLAAPAEKRIPGHQKMVLIVAAAILIDIILLRLIY